MEREWEWDRTRAINIVKLVFLLFLLLIIGLSALRSQTLSQTDSLFIRDSIRVATPKSLRPQFRIDARASAFEGQKINIYGYDAGVLIENRLRIALGYYRIKNELPNDVDLLGSKTKLQLGIDCGALNTEVVFYDARYLSFGFPLEFGFGNYSLVYHDALTGRVLSEKDGFLGFANFGLSAVFKPIRWFGLKGIAGYRKTIYPGENIFPFNGVFSAIGLNIDVQEIVKDIRMYRLIKKYNRNFSRLRTFTALMTD
jgi:hypothetical protein